MKNIKLLILLLLFSVSGYSQSIVISGGNTQQVTDNEVTTMPFDPVATTNDPTAGMPFLWQNTVSGDVFKWNPVATAWEPIGGVTADNLGNHTATEDVVMSSFKTQYGTDRTLFGASNAFIMNNAEVNGTLDFQVTGASPKVNFSNNTNGNIPFHIDWNGANKGDLFLGNGNTSDPDDVSTESVNMLVIDQVSKKILQQPLSVNELADADGDTGVNPVEGGGANGGDLLPFTVDGIQVGNVQIQADGTTAKWNLFGDVDPETFTLTSIDTTVAYNKAIANGLNNTTMIGRILRHTDNEHYVWAGTYWRPFGSQNEKEYETVEIQSNFNVNTDYTGFTDNGTKAVTISNTDPIGNDATVTYGTTAFPLTQILEEGEHIDLRYNASTGWTKANAIVQDYDFVDILTNYNVGAEYTGGAKALTLNNTNGGPFTVTYGTAGNPQTISLADGESVELIFDALSGGYQLRFPVSDPVELSAAATNLVPNHYVTTAAADYTVSLSQEKGVWNFHNPDQTAKTNAITIDNGAAATFTDVNGAQVTGTFVINTSVPFWIVNTGGANDYYVSVPFTESAASPFIAGGNWDASTNTPDLNVAANRADTNGNLFIYNINGTGSVDLGNGLVNYEAGGEIKFFSPTSFRYDPPSASLDKGVLANFLSTDPDYEIVKNWDGKTIDERIKINTNWKYSSTDEELEANTKYQVANGNYTFPANPVDGNEIVVQNVSPAKSGLTSVITAPIYAAVTGSVRPVFNIPPASAFRFIYNAALGGWVFTPVKQGVPLYYSDADFTANEAELGLGSEVYVNITTDQTLILSEVPRVINKITLLKESTGTLTVKIPDAVAVDMISTEIKGSADIRSFTITPDNFGQTVTLAGFAETNRWVLSRPWEIDLKNNDIPDWLPTTNYTDGDQVIAPRPTDGIEFIYQRTTIGTSGTVFDATEEGEWSQIGEAPRTTEILESITLTLKGYASSFTTANTLVFVDKNGVDYNMTDWAVLADSDNAIPVGAIYGARSIKPATNGDRIIKLGYVGSVQKQGLSAFRINLRSGVSSTGVSLIQVSYFSGYTYTQGLGGAAQNTVTYDINGTDELDFLTQVRATAVPDVVHVADEAARLAIADPLNGDEVIQDDDESQWLYDGTVWVERTASGTPIIFDSIGDIASDVVFEDGERIIIRSGDLGSPDYPIEYVWEVGSTTGGYTLNNGSLTPVGNQTQFITLGPDGGNDEIVSFSQSDASFGDGANDLAPAFEYYYVRRNTASTATQSFESGVTLVIPADDFDVHMFRRTSETAVEYLGKPFTNTPSQDAVYGSYSFASDGTAGFSWVDQETKNTANNIVNVGAAGHTLANGMYKIVYTAQKQLNSGTAGVVYQIDGVSTITGLFTGPNGGTSMTDIIDATASNKIIRFVRTASSGQGNTQAQLVITKIRDNIQYVDENDVIPVTNLEPDIEIGSWQGQGTTPSSAFTGKGKYDFTVDMDGITNSAASGTLGIRLRNNTDNVDIVSKTMDWRSEGGAGSKIVHKTIRFEAELVEGKSYTLIPGNATGLANFSFNYGYAVPKITGSVVRLEETIVQVYTGNLSSNTVTIPTTLNGKTLIDATNKLAATNNLTNYFQPQQDATNNWYGQTNISTGVVSFVGRTGVFASSNPYIITAIYQ